MCGKNEFLYFVFIDWLDIFIEQIAVKVENDIIVLVGELVFIGIQEPLKTMVVAHSVNPKKKK